MSDSQIVSPEKALEDLEQSISVLEKIIEQKALQVSRLKSTAQNSIEKINLLVATLREKAEE